MGLFDFLKKENPKARQPSETLERSSESYDDFMKQLREERKEKTKPTIVRKNAQDRFYAYCGSQFDFSDVPVYSFDGGSWYLLDGAIADKIVDDMVDMNKVLKQTADIANLPDFSIPVSDILLKPEWIVRGYEMGWKMSHISPSTLTKTGKLPKYAFTVFLVSRSGSYSATIKYLQNDTIGNAEVGVFCGKSLYIVTIREKEIVRIMRNQNGENFPIYVPM